MPKKMSWVQTIVGFCLFAAGVVCVLLTRSAAITESAGDAQKLGFSVSLVCTLVGLLIAISAFLPRREVAPRQLAQAAMFAALSFVGFMFFKIDIPVGNDKTAFHLGNVFCVLGALLLGGFWGGAAGAVGMTLADFMTGYVTSAPKTFLLKFAIGLIVGLAAHRGFHLSHEKPAGKVTWQAAVAAAAGMAFNTVADPVVGYFYKTYVLGQPQDAAKLLAKMAAVTTFVNSVIAVITATVLYAALRPALKKARLYTEL